MGRRLFFFFCENVISAREVLEGVFLGNHLEYSMYFDVEHDLYVFAKSVSQGRANQFDHKSGSAL